MSGMPHTTFLLLMISEFNGETKQNHEMLQLACSVCGRKVETEKPAEYKAKAFQSSFW
jgi:5-methylcytosine-specific restriction endonuclease McrA